MQELDSYAWNLKNMAFHRLFSEIERPFIRNVLPTTHRRFPAN
jgi:hypothetical protein